MDWEGLFCWFVEDVFMRFLGRSSFLSFQKETKSKSRLPGTALDTWFWECFWQWCWSSSLHQYWNLCTFREQKTILQDRFLLIWEKSLGTFENLGILSKILRFRINIMEIYIIRISLLGLLLFNSRNNKNLTSAQWSQFFLLYFLKKVLTLKPKMYILLV